MMEQVERLDLTEWQQEDEAFMCKGPIEYTDWMQVMGKRDE